MPKIMLVEDDNNLREIYGERLLAEGYEIVSASDGEEALALAVKEKPDLIISDVMMPKISGFDMLDILRQTPETKNTQVIMMTALSQAEDKERADKLGADKYLVKSQVTLEDVARVVHDMIYGPEPEAPAAAAPEASAPLAPAVEPVSAPQPVVAAPEPVVSAPQPVAVAPEPVVSAPEPVVAAPAEPVAVTAAPAPVPVAATSFVPPTPDPIPAPEPVTTAPEPVAVTEPTAPEVPAAPAEAAPIDQTAAATEAANDAQDVASEKASVDDQIQSFLDGTQPAAEVAAPAAPEAPAEVTAPAPTEPAVIEPTELPAATAPAEPTEEPLPANIPRPMDENVAESASTRKKVIEPISDPTATPNINELYEKEMAAEAANTPIANPSTGTVIGSPEQPETAASDPQNPASFAL